MRFALRTAACCATIVAALWPTKAIGDEAALKRTAPDECIAWFSWAGLDALAKDGPKTNRTEQLLADEEVRAFLDSIAKNLDGAIDVGDDENTKHFAQLFRVLSKRPAVAYLSKIAQVKCEAPPKAPEPPTAPPKAAVVPTMKTAVGEDGLERIGIDFDVQVTAGDLPAAHSVASANVPAVAPQLEVRVGPGGPPRIGRVRTVEKNGEKRREVELVWPHATEWREFEVDVPINDDGSWGKGSDRPVARAELEAIVSDMAPSTARFGRSRTIVVDGKARKQVEVIWPHATEWVGIDFEHKPEVGDAAKKSTLLATAHDVVGVAGFARAVDTPFWIPREGIGTDKFVQHWEADEPAGEPAEHPTPAETQAAFDSARTKIQAGFQTNATPDVSPKSPSVPAPKATFEVDRHPTFVDIDAIVHETQTGTPTVSRGVNADAAIAATVCTACSGCTSCESSTTVSVMHGAVVVDLGEHLAETKALYDKLTAEGSELPKQKIADIEFAKLAWDQPMYLAFHDAYLILAFDETSAEQCASGLAGKREVPKWLVAAEAKLPVERPAARLHVNIDGIAKLVDEPFEEPSQEFVKLLGLDQVSAISFVAGLDDRGTAIKTLLTARTNGPEISRRTPRRPRDRQQEVPVVFDFFSGFLTPDDLSPIPRDATMAAAGKIDVKKILGLGLKLAKLEDDEAESAWEEAKKYLAERLFIDLSKDIVEALGSTWTLHYSSSEGGLMATTFTFTVRDEARLKTALEKLALVANAENAYVRKFTYRGQDVYYWQGGDDGGSAAWCIRDGRLVASLLPQTIKAHIARGPLKETLADVPDVRKLLPVGEKPTSGPLVLSYTDTRGILEWCYQYGSFLLPTIGQQLAQADECTLALHDFPSLAVIEQYFAPSITTVSRTDAGLLIDSRQTVPMMSGLMALSALATVDGFEVGDVDANDVLASVATLTGVVPVGVSMGTPAVSGECVSGQCTPYPATVPSPYWHGDDVQYFTPPPGNTPQPPPPVQSKPGPWTPVTPPPTPSRYDTPMPYGTPVPYHVPSAVGQPYIPPPPTPPNLPANYQSPKDPPISYPVPPSVPHSTPIGFPPPPAAVPMKPGDSYPKAPPAGSEAVPLSAILENVPAGKLWSGRPAAVAANPGVASAYAIPTPSYPPAPSGPPVAAAYAAPDVPGYPAPAASPSYAPAISGNWSNPYATPPAANYEPPARAPATKEPATAKPAAETKPAAKPAPNSRPSRRLLRRRAAVSSPYGKNVVAATANTEATIEAKAATAVDSTTGSRMNRVANGFALSTYFIEPPDILVLDMDRATPKEPYTIETFDALQIVVERTLDGQPIAGVYTTDPGGYIQFGPGYGGVKVKGLSLAEARIAIEEHLRASLTDPRVSVSLEQIAGQHQIVGEHLVGLDGTVNLGRYGTVYISGLTIAQTRAAIEKHLSQYLESPSVSVAMFGYETRKSDASRVKSNGGDRTASSLDRYGF